MYALRMFTYFGCSICAYTRIHALAYGVEATGGVNRTELHLPLVPNWFRNLAGVPRS